MLFIEETYLPFKLLGMDMNTDPKIYNIYCNFDDNTVNSFYITISLDF